MYSWIAWLVAACFIATLFDLNVWILLGFAQSGHQVSMPCLLAAGSSLPTIVVVAPIGHTLIAMTHNHFPSV